MAKNNGPSANNARDKAKAMREAQKKKDARVRNLIIGIVSVIVVAVVTTVIVVIATSGNPNNKYQGGGVSQSGEVLSLEEGGPIVISDKGVGVLNEDLPNLEMYFSYTCHWCAYLENAVGDDLFTDAENGKFNLIIHPVSTSAAAFLYPSTAAALLVAQEDPENFIAFHQAMTEYVNQKMNVDSDTEVLMDPTASLEMVKELAAQAGVSQAVIDKFNADSTDYLEASSARWSAREVIGRGDQLGTPELVFMNTVVPWSQGTSAQIYAQITQEMQNIADAQSAD